MGITAEIGAVGEWETRSSKLEVRIKPEGRSSKRGGACAVVVRALVAALVVCAAGAWCRAEAYLFASFRGNGEDGLHLAWSGDGYRWEALNGDESYLKPEVGGRLMRDPSLLRGPDGTFHMVWTTGWKGGDLGYASSKDLVHWSPQRAIKVMEDHPDVENVWAPELFYDEGKGEFLIFWASTVPGLYPETANAGEHNHRIYYVTTKDFVTFSPTKPFYNGGFNVIDAAMFKDGGKYYLVVKNETKVPVEKNLRLVEGKTAEGPWGEAGKPFSGSWVEGPSPLKVGDAWVVYFDHYAKPQYYGAMRSRDLKTWEDVSKDVSFPKGTRHGTAVKVPDEVVEKLRSHQ